MLYLPESSVLRIVVLRIPFGTIHPILRKCIHNKANYFADVRLHDSRRMFLTSSIFT
jgi:hypothetical protein